MVRGVEIEEPVIGGREERYAVTQVGQGGTDACGGILEAQCVGHT